VIHANQQDVATIKPLGVGLSVAFVWALAAQMLTSVLLTFLYSSQRFIRTPTHSGRDYVSILGYLIAAALLAGWGDGLRSGRQWAWGALCALTALLSIGGLVMLPSSLQAAGNHDFYPLWSQIILLTLPPFILYRLLQPATRQWYQSISMTAARARHNAPSWLAAIIGSAAVGGALTAIFQRLS